MKYEFATIVRLEPVMLQRIEDEKKSERIHNDFEHHLNPLRGMSDLACVRAEVEAPSMSELQIDAFEKAMTKAMYVFERSFRDNIEFLHQMESDQ